MTTFEHTLPESHDDDCIYVRLDEPLDVNILCAEEGITIDLFNKGEN